MNLLIVDDAMSVVNGLRDNIDWAAIGVTQTFGAYSAFEARLILRQNLIDILLSDIEMPIEDGLSLVGWVREQKMDICVILLTAHAKFQYAQQSVKLDAFDYVLQPCPYHEIAAVVERAVRKVKQDALAKEMNRFGKKYMQNREDYISAALWNWLTGVEDPARVRELAEKEALPREEQFAAVGMLQPINWDMQQPDPKLVLFGLQDMLTKLCMPAGWRSRVISAGSGIFGMAVWADSDLDPQLLRRQIELLRQICQQDFGFQTAVYMSESAVAGQIPSLWKRTARARLDNLAKTPGFFRTDGRTKEDARLVLDHKISQEWAMQLAGAHPSLVEAAINEFLDGLILEQRMNARTLQDFYHEYMNILHRALVPNCGFWEIINGDPARSAVYHNARYSLEDMRELVHLSVTYMASQNSEPDTELLKKIDAYIDEHMEETIHRSELAETVFLNADYLNRLFKQETGQTLKEYIIQRKMDMARRLLITTRLPVNLVAARVGFAQLSHFSTTYKKIFGHTPLHERKEPST